MPKGAPRTSKHKPGGPTSAEADSRAHAAHLAELLINAAAQSRESVEQLLTDLLTPAERKDLWERWRIIDLLLQGRSQREVRDALGVSISKVTRGSSELQYGTGAFRKLWEKITGP